MREPEPGFWDAETARRERTSLTFAFASAQEGLEEELTERTVELSKASAAVVREIEARWRAEAESAELSQLLARAREDEQRRLARDLHDQTGPGLTALSLAVAQLKRSCDPAATPELLASLASLERAVEQVGHSVREVVTRLRPAALDEFGLELAIEQLLQQWSASSDVEYELRWATPARRLPTDAETTLYRIVQEALTNVARHARATRVRVELQLGEWLGLVVIEDDGIGFDPACTPKGRLGLTGMRERLAPAQGSLEIDSGAERGTRITVRLPLRPNVGER